MSTSLAPTSLPAANTTPQPLATSLPRPMTPAPSTSLLPPPWSLSAGAIAGIAIGGVFSLVIISYVLKKIAEPFYHIPPQDDPVGLQLQHWEHNAPQSGNHVVTIPPEPSPPHATMPRPPPSPGLPPTIRRPPPPLMSSNTDSGCNYTGWENPLTPPTPRVVLGFSKSKFTYEELSKATDGFSEANFLGQGGFGIVHKGKLPNAKEVAVKQLKEGSHQRDREFKAEVEIISRVHHKHLVTLVGYCIAGSHRILVYEFVPNNTLEFHLHGEGRPNMDWPTRLKSALGAAKGLEYLHEYCDPKIIHRDIKSANILLDFNFEAKVADFGLAKKCSSNAGKPVFTGRVVGTRGYLAPEYALKGILTDKADVYSFGVMLLELITGRKALFSSPSSPPSSKKESLVEWAMPLLTQALEGGNFDDLDKLVDPLLPKDHYDRDEMVRMVKCAAYCVKPLPQHRPQMSQVGLALERHLSLSDLNAKIPGHSTASITHGSSDYNTSMGRTTLELLPCFSVKTDANMTFPV